MANDSGAAETPAGGLLASENLCGATLLQLTASGSAIIAELLRLSSAVPAIFARGTATPPRPQSDATASPAAGKDAHNTTTNGHGADDDAEYEAVCFDFAYLKEPEEFENRVTTTQGLLDLDTDFLEAHGAFAARAYALFESMVKYWRDVRAFLERLAAGYYIRHSLENLLEDVDGKQIVSEAFFLYGSMLLLMEARIPGVARERLVVACYRSAEASSSRLDLVDDVCKLVRRTEGSKKRSKGAAPLEILATRFCADSDVLLRTAAKAVIATLASDDVYLTSSAFPDPTMRTTRLAAQASMLYVILHFDPDILRSDESQMRQVVDRHFADCWIVPVYMGHTVDLAREWHASRPYKAAAAALQNVLTTRKVRRLAAANKEMIEASLHELDAMLTEGHLTEQRLLDHMRELFDAVRRSNVALRWRLLHGPPTADSSSESLFSSPSSTVTLLLKTSQLEYKLKQMLQALLDSKAEKWAFCQKQVVDRMTELSDYFTGDKALARVKRDENLTRWFASLAKETASLDEDEAHATMIGRKIQTLIAALEEVEQFEQVDTNLQIKAFLGDTREFLLQMVRITNVQQSAVNILETISDLSYAWASLRDYVAELHSRVRRDPATAVLLRAMFLKLASILDVPLIRISQCVTSADAVSVAQYYSAELVTFARDVLDVIPISLFKVLDEIIDIQTFRLAPLPVKFETLYLKDYAQLEERYELAKLTNQVAVFTEGVLAIEKTLLGVIRVEPRRILHDGLRKELVRQLAVAMRDALVFTNVSDEPSSNSSNGDAASSTKSADAAAAEAAAAVPASTTSSFTAVLDRLAAKVDGYRRSVEYVQDYIDIAGLKMWQEELARLVNYAVEQEANRYVRRKVYDAESRYQSKVAPIPAAVVRGVPRSLLAARTPPAATTSTKGGKAAVPRAVPQDPSLTFMGRTLFALAKLTAPEASTYAPEACAWFTSSTEVLPATLWGAAAADKAKKRGGLLGGGSAPKETPKPAAWPAPRKVCGVETFDAVERALGVVGLAGLDTLLALHVVHELTKFVDEYKARAKPLMALIERLRDDALEPDWLPPAGGDPAFYAATAKKLDPLASLAFHRIRKIGHCQLLRRSVAHSLSLRARLDASHLHQALEAVDVAVLDDVREHYRKQAGSSSSSSQDDDDDAGSSTENPYPLDSPTTTTTSTENLLPRLARLLDAAGFADPLEKVYVAAEPLRGLPAVLLVVVLSAAAKLDYDPRLGTLVKRKSRAPLDGYVLVVGVVTVLKQFHPAYTRQLLAYLGQFVGATLQALPGGQPTSAAEAAQGGSSSSKKGSAALADAAAATEPLPNELLNVAWFVTHLAREAKLPNVTDFIPADVLHLRPTAGRALKD